MSDLLRETLLTLPEVPARLPRPVGRVTVWNWVRVGVRRGAVKLEAVRVGGRWLTSAEVRGVAQLPEDQCAPWAPLLVRVAREGLA